MRITQDMKYLGALEPFFKTFDMNQAKVALSHFARFDDFAPLLHLEIQRASNPSMGL
jgi:hypothetical protein